MEKPKKGAEGEDKHKQRLSKLVFWTNKHTLPPIGITSTFTKGLLYGLASILVPKKKNKKILRKINNNLSVTKKI